MHIIKQLPNGLFGKPKAVSALAKAQTATLLCVSDSHGDYSVLSDIIINFGQKADCLVFCGDGIYDLMSIIEKSFKYREIAKSLPKVIAFVRGNNDYGLVQTSFNSKIFVPKKLILTAASRNILITHGNEEHVYYSTDLLEETARSVDCVASIYGHTHVPFEANHTVFCINPGSVSLPRALSPKSFAMLEVGPNYFCPIFYSIENSITTTFTPFHPKPFFY